MLQALRLIVRLRPGKANYIGQKHFCQLMPQGEVLGPFAALLREINASAALHPHVSVAGHPFQCGRHRRWSHVQFFREARADRCLVLFQHFPDRL